jgi:hypothetical protein
MCTGFVDESIGCSWFLYAIMRHPTNLVPRWLAAETMLVDTTYALLSLFVHFG